MQTGNTEKILIVFTQDRMEAGLAQPARKWT